ncbi:MAG: radical SAM protein, partial [Myxococcota bacterium]|nr:radical SAM protein [Myxococcota bacterium]
MTTHFELRRQIEDRLDKEVGTIYKEAACRVSLVYPSPYRIGMSSLGFQAIYRLLNERDGVVCERSFLPDDLDAYRANRTPLLTYESQVPAADADIVALSIAYETEVIGLIDCLDLMGLPFKAEERDARYPLVILGGPLTFSNPLPVAPFADLIVMGEGDELIGVLLDGYRASTSRAPFLEDVALWPGGYVPRILGAQLRPVAQA